MLHYQRPKKRSYGVADLSHSDADANLAPNRMQHLAQNRRGTFSSSPYRCPSLTPEDHKYNEWTHLTIGIVPFPGTTA